MDYTKFLKIKCDWQSNVDGMDIKDCVVAHLKQSEHETAEIDVFDLIEDSNCNCVNFMKSEDQKDLFVNISCDPKHLISTICVCSEAKIVELFGKNGEYVSTHSALSSQGINEYTMNYQLININSINCSLKLGQLKNTDFAWIYGIFVFLTGAKEYSNASLGPINMQNVQNLLNPESLAINASKLFSTLSLKESKSINNDFLNSILNMEKNKLLLNDNGSQLVLQKQFESRVEERLNSMTLQLNNIGNNVETLNKKFDTLLKLFHEKHGVT